VTVVGVLALLLAIIGGGGFTTLSRRLNGYSAFERTFAIFSLGLVWFFTAALLRGIGPAEIWAARRLPWFLISVFYLGALSSVAAYYLFNASLNVLTVARSAAFVNWTTVVSILAGVFILGEPFTWVQVLGSVLIIGGLWGANYFAKPAGELPADVEEKP
jgi:drug/metabolite transporter (DMT)-like permease